MNHLWLVTVRRHSILLGRHRTIACERCSGETEIQSERSLGLLLRLLDQLAAPDNLWF